MRCILVVLLCLSAGLAAGEALTPLTAGRTTQTDAQGFNWDIEPRSGAVNDGSNDCFDTALGLQLNGQPCNIQQPMQTKDGELVLAGSDDDGDGVTVTRRIRLEAQLGVVRYLEVLTNASPQPRTVTLLLQSCLGGNAQAVLTTSGAAFAGGALGPKDAGVYASQAPNSSRPAVLFITGMAKAAVQPQVSCGDRRQFSIQYQVTIPAGQRVAVLHLVGQRRGQNDVAKETAALLKAIPKMGLPAELRRLVVNMRLQAETEVMVGGLPALDAWCAAHDLVRSGEDQLLTGRGDGQQARGAVRGTGVAITLPSGRQSIPLAEIAGVVGAAGPGAAGRIFLRTGEVLLGDLSANDLALVAGGGSIPVDPATTPGLILRGDRRDGQDVGAGLVALPDGDQLALATAPAPATLIGAIGAVAVDFASVARIVRLRGERLGWEVAWADGSRLSGFLDGKALALATRRRGTLTLPVHELEGFLHPARGVPEDLERVDHAELSGGDRLVGALAGPSLVLQGRAGAVTVESARVQALTRDGEGGFVIELVGGGQVVGQGQGAGLVVVRPGGSLTVPWQLLERWVKAVTVEAAPPPVAPADPRLALPVTLPVTEAPLAQAAAQVATQLKLRLTLGAGIDPHTLPLRTVPLGQGPAAAILDALLLDTGYGYRLEGDRLLIERVAAEPVPAPEGKP